ncbi:MAG: SsrA-binding protein [Bdellovibrio sp.]|nr:MAG: SsrA-binding protein [Bdellovibrio sp.]
MSGILLIAENRKARFDYEILQTFEAGLVLMGSEVKSLRAKQIQLKDSYVSFRGDEAYLQNAHIAEYRASSYNNHVPERLRKLLLHRRELDRLNGTMREKGLSCVPLKVYFKNGRVKVELALVRGKKARDKRESIKKREVDRALRQQMRT